MNQTIFKILPHLSGVIHAGMPVLTKLLFTLGFIKIISTNGQAGSLATWGNVQNTIGLAAVVLGLSIQSGIASNTASRKDDHALLRGLLVVAVMAGAATFALFLAGLLRLNVGFNLPIYAVLLGGASASIFGYLSSFLPVKNKFRLLFSMNFLFGFFVTLFLLLKGSHSVKDQALSLSLGYFFSVAFSILMLRSSIFNAKHLKDLCEISKYFNLIRYGIASSANTVSMLLVLMVIRVEVLAEGGGASGDTFEAAVRLVALLEGSAGLVIGMLVWKQVGLVGYLQRSKQAVFVSLMLVVAGFFCLAMLVFGDLLTALIFSPDYKFDYFVIIMMSAYAAMKLASTVLIIPAFIEGKINFLLLVEAAYAFVGLVCFYWLVGLDVLSVVENALVAMFSGILFVNLLLVLRNGVGFIEIDRN